MIEGGYLMKSASQYDETVHASFRNSACGPTAVHILLSHYHIHYTINDLYRHLQTSVIGLFTPLLLHNLRKLLGNDWYIERATLGNALHDVQIKRPVLMKFDQYFSWQFYKSATFRYHWVVLVDYQIDQDELYLLLINNGKEQWIHYGTNAHALSFVQVSPRKK